MTKETRSRRFWISLMLLAVTSVLTGCGQPYLPGTDVSASRPGMPGTGSLPPEQQPDTPEADLSGYSTGDLLGYFRNTYYYLVLEDDFAGQPRNTTLLDIRGNILARVSAAYKKAIAMEGSGKLQDGRVLNFAAHADDGTRYRITHNTYGDGVGECALDPFHTIAVDPRVIPFGTWVKIEETEGMRLPDGSVHNGIWKAEDRGAWITNDRIDLFVGAGQKNGRYLDAAGIQNLQALTVRLVAPPSPNSCVHRGPNGVPIHR